MDLAAFLDPEQLSQRLAFHKRLVDEEAEAEVLCERLLTGPSAWWGNAIRNAGPPTSGLVRELIERTARMLRQVPTDALILAKLASERAETISVTAYPYDHVYRIRGEALREEAWTHVVLGNFFMAADAADRAERSFREFSLPLEIDLARLDLVRSGIAAGTGRFADAIELAERAGETFQWYGDRRGWVKSCDFRVAAYWNLGDYKRARETLQLQDGYLDLLTPEQSAARFHNIAMCQRELGDLDGAARSYTRAIAEAERNALPTSAAHSRGSLGVLLLLAGHTGEAIDALREAWNELEALGMAFAATTTALRLVEALLIAERFDDVPPICRMLIDRCTKAGMSDRALTALGFLREAVAKGLATPQHVHYVEGFLRDGDAQEQFVPMPLQ